MDSHISSLVIYKVNAGFLNGAGNDSGNNNTTTVKSFIEDGKKRPYVSTQAWRKWMRDAFVDKENSIGYYNRIDKKISIKKNESYSEGMWVDPIYYIEDDIFGYSHPLIKIPKQEDPFNYNVVSLQRAAPFQTTALVPLLDAKICDLKGFLHLDDSSPLPYTTQFMNGFFKGYATLDLNRVGVFENYWDIIEIDPIIAEYYINNEKLIYKKNNDREKYILKSLDQRRRKVLDLYFYMLKNANAPPKSSQFAASISPRLITSVISDSANNFLGNIITDFDGEPYIDKQLLKERIKHRGHTLKSDIYIGYRNGTFKNNEEMIYELDEMEFIHKNGKVSIKITTPGKVEQYIKEELYE